MGQASQCLHFSFNDNPLDRAGEPQHFLNVCVMCFEGIFFDSYITVDKVCKFLQAPTFSSFLSVGRLCFSFSMLLPHNGAKILLRTRKHINRTHMRYARELV